MSLELSRQKDPWSKRKLWEGESRKMQKRARRLAVWCCLWAYGAIDWLRDCQTYGNIDCLGEYASCVRAHNQILSVYYRQVQV
jgi:hypothetical protein